MMETIIPDHADKSIEETLVGVDEHIRLMRLMILEVYMKAGDWRYFENPVEYNHFKKAGIR